MSRRTDLLDRRGAAAYLGVSATWISQHPPAKGGPPRVQIGGRVWYRQIDLDWFIDEKCRQTEEICISTKKETPLTGGVSSDSRRGPKKAAKSVDQRAKQIEDELRSKLAASGQTSKRTPPESPRLQLVTDSP